MPLNSAIYLLSPLIASSCLWLLSYFVITQGDFRHLPKMSLQTQAGWSISAGFELGELWLNYTSSLVPPLTNEGNSFLWRCRGVDDFSRAHQTNWRLYLRHRPKLFFLKCAGFGYTFNGTLSSGGGDIEYIVGIPFWFISLASMFVAVAGRFKRKISGRYNAFEFVSK